MPSWCSFCRGVLGEYWAWRRQIKPNKTIADENRSNKSTSRVRYINKGEKIPTYLKKYPYYLLRRKPKRYNIFGFSYFNRDLFKKMYTYCTSNYTVFVGNRFSDRTCTMIVSSLSIIMIQMTESIFYYLYLIFPPPRINT